MKSKPLRLPDPVVIGMAVMHHGQRFVLCRTQPYVTLGGARSLVLHWRSHCATCGQPFEMTTGAVVWNLNRRCAMHHGREQRSHHPRSEAVSRTGAVTK